MLQAERYLKFVGVRVFSTGVRGLEPYLISRNTGKRTDHGPQDVQRSGLVGALADAWRLHRPSGSLASIINLDRRAFPEPLRSTQGGDLGIDSRCAVSANLS